MEIREKPLERARDDFKLVEQKNESINPELAEAGWVLKSDINLTELLFLSIQDAKNNILAVAKIALSENTNLDEILLLPKESLKNSIFIHSVWVSPGYTETNLLPVILYLALRRGRILQRTQVVSLVKNPEGAVATILKLSRLSHIEIKDSGDGFIPVAQMLDYAIYLAAEQCHNHALAIIKKYFLSEIQETVEIWLEGFFKGSWAQAIFNENITRQQYIATLCHWHQFVRQTTQHIARAIAAASDRELRNHYIYHFKGEINHELLIEHDLKQFDYDLNFLLNVQMPTEATKEFMIIQESTIGFHQNPVLLLACPLAAEGMTAAIKPEFLDSLYRRIASWGIKEPKSAARFISSHVNTDGGDDGHWNHVLQRIGNYINSEKLLQNFLSILNVAMHSYERAHNANVDNYKLWSVF